LGTHRAQGAPQAPPGPMPPHSNPTECAIIDSSFASFPSRARLNSACLYNSAFFSSVPFALLLFFGSHHRSRRGSPSPEPPRPLLLRTRAALLVARHFCLPTGLPSLSTTAESARRRHTGAISSLRLLGQETLGALWPCSAACSLRMLPPMW